MTRRQTIPRQWLIADQRMSDDLWRVARALSRGSGIVLFANSAPASSAACAIWRLAGS